MALLLHYQHPPRTDDMIQLVCPLTMMAAGEEAASIVAVEVEADSVIVKVCDRSWPYSTEKAGATEADMPWEWEQE